MGLVPSALHLVGFPTDVISHRLQGFTNQPCRDPRRLGHSPKNVLGEPGESEEVGKERGSVRRRMHGPVYCHHR